MPELVKGYHTDPATGKTAEYDMFKGDLREACEKFPKEWSKSSGKSGAAKPVRKAKSSWGRKFGKSAASRFVPAPPPSGAEDDQ